MAVDTRNERAGALAFALPFARVFDDPDNAFGQADRQQSALAWPGLLVESTAPGQPIRRRAMHVPGAWQAPQLFGPKPVT